MDKFKYVKENQLISGGYINIPIKLYNSPRYIGLSNDAILLYGVLRNKFKFSATSGLRDEEGRLFVLASISEITNIIRCSKNTARKILEELKKHYLIKFNENNDKNRFRNIYIGEIGNDDSKGSKIEPIYIKKSTSKGSKAEHDCIKKSTSTGSNYEPLRGQILTPNKNIYKNTYKNGIYQKVGDEGYPYYKEFDFDD